MKGQAVYQNISEDAARALENIVGGDNFTTDPVIRAAYIGRGLDREVIHFLGASRAPAAIIMPNTTEQVVDIVKTCNRYSIPYVPMATFGMAFGGPNFRDDILLIDLKRMNRMRLDVKNMFVVLETGVTFAQMHGETLRQGLIGCMPGGGGGVSVLANQIVNGMGLFNYRINYAAQRRWNGIEWVSPEGEIYRFGSLAGGEDDWFWQDGMGPNLSGLLHGITSWGGGMGIITRMSTRLYPFPPEKLEPMGIGINSCVKIPEDRIKWVNASFQSESDLYQAIQEIGKARIGFVVNRVPSFWRDIAKSREDVACTNQFWNSWNKRTAEQVVGSRVLRVCLVGRASEAQLDYEERILNDIIEEHNGVIRPARQVDEASFFAANSLGMWAPTGVFGECDGGIESLKCNRATREHWMRYETEPEYIKDFLNPKGDSPWYMSYSMGRQYYTELHAWPDARQIDPEDFSFRDNIPEKFLRWRVSRAGMTVMQTGIQSFFYALVQPLRLFAPAHHNFDVWLDRFKQEFDPKGLSNPGQPYIIDRIVNEMYPGAITDELRVTIAKVAAGPWQGNAC